MLNLEFELFVSGYSDKSTAAVSSLEQICRTPEFNDCSLKVVNVSKNPELALLSKVLAVPALIIKRSGLERRVVGDLDNIVELSRELSRWKTDGL